MLEAGRIAALGSAPVTLPAGESITADFGYVRSPAGLRVDWGEAYGADFSVSVSEDGKNFRQMGRIANGQGLYDNFYWPSIAGRFVRFTLHAASSPEGATVEQIKLRVLSKDRMPIGLLERAACAGRDDLYPQSLLGRQVYWTVLAEAEEPEEALFDEYGDLEPRQGVAQITPLLRVDGKLHGAPEATRSTIALRRLAAAAGRRLDGSGSRSPGERACSRRSRGRRNTGLLNSSARRAGRARSCWRCARADRTPIGSTAATRPSTPSRSRGGRVRVNDRLYATFSRDPDAVTVARLRGGDAVRLIEQWRAAAIAAFARTPGFSARHSSSLFRLLPARSRRGRDRRLSDAGRREPRCRRAVFHARQGGRARLEEEDRAPENPGWRPGSDRDDPCANRR